MEDFALDGIKRRLHDPAWIKGYKERLEKVLSAISKESSSNIEQIDNELKGAQIRIGNIVDAIEKGQDKDILGDRLTELKLKRDRLLDMRSQANNMSDNNININKMVDEALKRFRNLNRLFAQGENTEKKAFLK